LEWFEDGFDRYMALEIAKEYEPEVVFLNDYGRFDNYFVRELRLQCKELRLVLSWCGTIIRDTDIIKLAECDMVLTSCISLQNDFIAKGIRTELLRHAFDPRILDSIGRNHEKKYPYSFLGGISLIKGAHNNRLEYLTRMSECLDIAVFSGGKPEKLPKIMIKQLLFNTSEILKKAGFKDQSISRIPYVGRSLSYGKSPWNSYKSLAKIKFYEACYGLELYLKLGESELSFNIHGDAIGDYSGNIRMFEATGMGACLITDWKKDLGDLFDLENEVVSYKSMDECIDKVQWLLKNPSKLQEISLAGQKRVLKDHSYENRVCELDYLINKYIKEIG
jgi:spore maturation protein CgeB